MPTRREFLSIAASLAGTAGAMSHCLDSLARAAAIEPAAESSYLDAEHIVILMQENRSFDHAFGTLRGVRGFNDPRAITLPDGNPVWAQADAKGQRFVPFRLDIKATKATWMGCLPHSWADQVDARHDGLYDRWLPTKRSGSRDYADMPLTLGYYTRADIPFYYALADAFTICDQYFCSSLTGTTPNRCYLWSGTIRERPSQDAPANVRNEEVEYESMVEWPTFPERLEDLGVSWKVYQNEITIDSGFSEAEDAWLANFGDNPLEYFNQYHVRLAPVRRAFVERRIKELPAQIETLRRQSATKADESGRRARRLAQLSAELKKLQAEQAKFRGKSLEALSPRERALHDRAFATNTGDPSYRQLADLAYRENGVQRRMRVPKGDVLYQFRQDVQGGRLPTVSWIVSPQTFSDHPSSPWYGAWYIAEVLDILTKNPDVWKKTIFLLTYDENDGYFDHVPPFVAPHPGHPETGTVTAGIDASVEYVELSQDRKRVPEKLARGSSIGLGYRVPMVIASPWSRGGCVCSQVFDHTSVLQFLEQYLSRKLGRKVEEPNISQWRRAVCGDLTASFQSSADARNAAIAFPPRDEFLESINEAQFKAPPADFHALSQEDLERLRQRPVASSLLPRQESGTRPSSPLPYQLAVEGSLNRSRTHFTIRFEAGNTLFGPRAAGAPFTVYALGSSAKVTVRNYAVEAGKRLEDAWALSDFAGGRYHLRVYGPNGFFREFTGTAADPSIEMRFGCVRAHGEPPTLTGDVALVAANRDSAKSVTIELQDHAYGTASQTRALKPGEQATFTVPSHKSAGWYDFSCHVKPTDGRSSVRYAGRVETGRWSTSDPAIGRRDG
jgi:phospholipase C